MPSVNARVRIQSLHFPPQSTLPPCCSLFTPDSSSSSCRRGCPFSITSFFPRLLLPVTKLAHILSSLQREMKYCFCLLVHHCSILLDLLHKNNQPCFYSSLCGVALWWSLHCFDSYLSMSASITISNTVGTHWWQSLGYKVGEDKSLQSY